MSYSFSDPIYDEDYRSYCITSYDMINKRAIRLMLNGTIGILRLTVVHIGNLDQGYMLILGLRGLFTVRYDLTYSEFNIYGPRKALARMSQSK
jgi:hypothetical protein